MKPYLHWPELGNFNFRQSDALHVKYVVIRALDQYWLFAQLLLCTSGLKNFIFGGQSFVSRYFILLDHIILQRWFHCTIHTVVTLCIVISYYYYYHWIFLYAGSIWFISCGYLKCSSDVLSCCFTVICVCFCSIACC